MPSKHEIRAALERRYGLLRWRFENAERAVETLVGLKAVVDADERIREEKKQLRLKMDHLTHLMRVQVDPDWDPRAIEPIRPRTAHRRHGAISKAAYRVLKSAKQPLKTREIANKIAPELGVDPSDYRQINRIDVAVRAALLARVKDELVIQHEGAPTTWSIRRPDPRAMEQAFADSNSRSIL